MGLGLDIGTFRGIVTAVLMLLFVGLTLWAFGKRRHDTFSAAAKLPLEDDAAPPDTEVPR